MKKKCPRCGQYKMSPMWVPSILTGIFLVILSPFMFAFNGDVGEVFFYILLIVGGIIVVASPFIKGERCLNCGFKTE